MVRTALLALLLACGGGKETPVELAASGPVYSAAVANSLRAIASNCTMERVGAVEKRACRGRFGVVSIATTGNHLSALTIALPSKMLAEAKGHIGHGLKEVLGHEGVEALLARMSLLEVGQHAELQINNAKVTLTASGRSRIAPEYTVELVWP